MSEKPYSFGFLEQIADVHFAGGDWFGINVALDIAAPHNGPGTADITFSGISGGTPGFPIMTNVRPGLVSFISYAYPNTVTTTKAILKETHKTGGGLKVTGFAVKTISAFAGLLYMFDASSFPKIINVRTSWTGDLDTRFQSATGFWVQHNKMKPGLKFPTGQWFDLPFGAFAENISMSSGHADFVFNKTDLSVSGS